MPRMGDPETRPAEGMVVMATSPALEQQAGLLMRQAALVWLGGRRPRVSAATIADAIEAHSLISKEYFDVVPHYPEDFFITFRHPHHRDAVTAAPGKFVVGDLDIRVANWSPRAHADAVQLRHHVHLCLENVPLNAWNEEVVSKLIGGAAVTHYFDAATTEKADASSLNLWAWTANPSAIPKVMWLTIIGGSASGDNIVVSTSNPLPGFNSVGGSSSSASRQGRQGLTYRVIIHLDLHEDFAQESATRRQNKFDWLYGVVDGEAAVRDRNQPAVDARRNDDNDRRRRDDDEDRRRRDGGSADDRRGRDAGRQASWGGRLFRSRSRADGERRDRDDRREEDRRGRRHDGATQDGSGSGGAVRAGLDEVAPPLEHAQSTPLAVLRRNAAGTLVWRRIQLPRVDEAAPPAAPMARGRSPLRPASPRSARRRSRENMTPPGSPTSVLPLTPSSKDSRAAHGDALSLQAQEALRICSPARLVQPLQIQEPAPQRPPGFEDGPAPVLMGDQPVLGAPADGVRADSLPDGLQPLFQQQVDGLLGTPPPPPRRLPASRRKTLAGVSIGYTLRRSSARIRAAGRARVAPVEDAAQKFVYRGLGITQDGEDITEAAIKAFEEKFKEQISSEVICALRQIFKLDDANMMAAEEALIARGGAAALDHEEEPVGTDA